MLLASIVARVAKKSFGAFLHDEIFVPAGMKHSFVYENPGTMPKRPPPGCIPAIGYQWAKKKEQWVPSWGTPPDRAEKLLAVGDGAVWTNLDDMERWDAALRENKFLKTATMQLAITPSHTRDGKTNQYGFGWTIYPGESGKLNGYGHDGSWNGFQTTYYRYLVADRTTVVLSNRGNFDPDKFWYALDRVIEENTPAKK
jgi:CubicO group peptidase (beta-lactamase class C family)